MSNYTVSQVERLVGVKAHTLRVWERRYNFLRPNRTATNIRYYTDEHLKQLLNIRILMDHGYRISAIDRMAIGEIYEKVAQILSFPDKGNRNKINSLVISMLEMDEGRFDAIFRKEVEETGLLNTLLDLIYPFLSLVGGLWTTNKAIPAQEHFISCLIRQKIIAAIEHIPSPPPSAPSILLFLLEGEHHEINLLLAYFLAKNAGWKVYYLGQSVPTENMTSVIAISKPNWMLTLITTNSPTHLFEGLKPILDQQGTPLLIGGNLNWDQTSLGSSKVKYLNDLYEFLAFLDEYSVG